MREVCPQQIIKLKSIRKTFFRKQNKKNFVRFNEGIRALEVRVVGENGENLGVLKTEKAIELAREKQLDLVEVSSKAQPPVCRITDHGKYQYNQEKKEKKQKSKQKKSDLKGVRIGFKTSSHDLETKARQAEKFLKKGHKVRIEMRLKGRENAYKNLAQEKMDSFIEMISLDVVKEAEGRKNPRSIAITIYLAS